MKVLAILSVMCLAHLSTGQFITDLNMLGFGANYDDQNLYVTTNIRGRDLTKMDVLGMDDQTVTVVDICKFGFNGMYNLGFNNLYNQDMSDCLVLHIKGMKKHMNHAVVVIVKDTDPLIEIRNNDLNDDNTVIVTVHKKLGSFTKFDTNDDDITGIVDVKDTVGALKWIQMNIHKYGGNADQVILVCDDRTFGISNILKNTNYDGILFKQIIHQTGTFFNRGAFNDMFTRNMMYGGGLKDFNFGGLNKYNNIFNQDFLMNNDVLRNNLLTDKSTGRTLLDQQNLYDTLNIQNQNKWGVTNKWGLTNKLRTDLYQNEYYGNNFGTTNYQMNYLDNMQGLNDYNTKTKKDYGIGDYYSKWHKFAKRGKWRGGDDTTTYNKMKAIRCHQFGDC